MDVSVAARTPFLLHSLHRHPQPQKERDTSSTILLQTASTKRGIPLGANAVDLHYWLPDVQLANTGGGGTLAAATSPFHDDLALALQPPHPPLAASRANNSPPPSPMVMDRLTIAAPYLPEQFLDRVDPSSSSTAGPSSQADSSNSSRSKTRKFDIKMSHFSELAASEPDPDYTAGDKKDGAAGPVRTAKKRAGRERVKIELAPDQPATTQGKPRERVYVACLQCRRRKIRCDGAKPMCFNCTQRSTGICEYDSVPKRRGPDRFPGSRQRPAKSENHLSDGVQSLSSESAALLFTDNQNDAQTARSTSEKFSIRESSRRRRNTLPVENTAQNNARKLSALETLPLPINTQLSPQASREGPSHIHDHIVVSADTARSPARRYSVAYISPHARQHSVSSQETGSPTLVVPKISTSSFASSSVTPTSSVSEPYTPADVLLDGVPKVRHVESTPASFNDNVEQYDLLGNVGVAPHAPFHHYEKPAAGQSNLLPGNVGSSSTSSQWPSSSARSGISSSASPESSSLGDYSSPDAQPAQIDSNQAYIVDARNSLAAGDGYNQSIVDHQLHYRQLQSQDYTSLISHGAGLVAHPGNEWQKTAFYPDEGAPVLALSQPIEAVAEPHLYSYNPYQWAVPVGASVGCGTEDAAFITPTEEDEGAAQEQLGQQFFERQSYANTQRSGGFAITYPPSLEFVRKTWWDSLLDIFATEYYPASVATQDQSELGISCFINHDTPVSVAREQSSLLVSQNLQFLFRNSNFWFAFINLPLFTQTFYNPVTRDKMQPALVYAMLGMSYFLRSSSAELGANGMRRSIWLMDKAHAALEASVHASWIDGELAQAAWIVALYESAAHPNRSTTRTEAAFERLDNIIRAMSLTFLDAQETTVPSYTSGNDTRTATHLAHQGTTSRSYVYPQPLYNKQHQQQRSLSHALGYVPLERAPPPQSRSHAMPDSSAALPTCACMKLSLVHNWPQANEHTPMWLCTPAWHPDWTEAEIRREECRRLCWNTLSLTAGYTSYRAAMGVAQHELFVIRPDNFQLQFPGENLANLPNLRLEGLSANSGVHPTKETVWALYARAMLLWHACLRIRESNVSDHERAQFVNAVWRETDAIEAALNQHSCPLERAFLYGGREYLFNTRMYVSYEFRRFVPSVHAGAIHRQKAEEWLRHQTEVAKRIVQGLHMVTGIKNNLIARRPFFIFWLMGQISRCLQLWTLDNSLTFAIELSKKFLPPIDYLTALWPCEDQRRQYDNIRHRLEQACVAIGSEPPPPVNFSHPLQSQSMA